MYIHIGGEYTLAARFIIGIFDFDLLTQSGDEINIKYLADLEERLILETVSSDLPRSIIVTFDKVYLSPVSVTTLRQRLEDFALAWSETNMR